VQSTSTLREPSRFSLRAVGESWLDRIETGYSIPVFLIAFAATWTVIFSVAYWNADLHMDVLETWSVGRVFAWGFWKHPPLMGWIAHAWSCVFPLTNWSFRLLSMVNAAIALFAVDLIARRFVRGDARAVILFLLLLTPAYQFHAEKFNANSVLLAVWPLATYCFLRSFEGRTALWSIATGLLCAVAMLGKYYSIFLVIGFVGAALIHPKRSIYLRSPAPWIATASGLIALTPHLYWLVMNGFSPFHYAMESHSGRSLAHSVSSATFFVLTNLGYLIIPAVAWMTVSHVAPQKLLKAITSLNDGLFLLALVFAISICLPVIVVLAIHSDLPPAWHLQGCSSPS
jgi:4-amino-4-deoxy-L-arabinose transferase-like glycosyltransferase